MVSETKIDDTFPESQFLIEGFSTPYRLDRTAKGGGIYNNFWWMAAYRNTWMFLIHKSETLERLGMGSHFYKEPCVCETRNWMAAHRNTWMFLIHKLETLEGLRMGSHFYK